MFPDSKIARNFSMARTKAMYAINHVIAPYFKSLLLSSINTLDIHIYYFDESLNEVTQTCEMDLHAQLGCGMQSSKNGIFWPKFTLIYYNILTK